jgi:hypothetical protein
MHPVAFQTAAPRAYRPSTDNLSDMPNSKHPDAISRPSDVDSGTSRNNESSCAKPRVRVAPCAGAMYSDLRLPRQTRVGTCTSINNSLLLARQSLMLAGCCSLLLFLAIHCLPASGVRFSSR